MNKPLIFVANWKSYFSANQAKEWIERYCKNLSILAEKKYIALCPDAITIAYAVEKLSPLVKIGAQDCSAYLPGSYTGDISAQSLKDAGVQLCIIGHSETRKNQNKDVDLIAQKTTRLFEQNITPLICIGQDYKKDLSHILFHLKTNAKAISSYLLAFEPESAIGTNHLPSFDKIKDAIIDIKKISQQILPSIKTSVLYGGSVNKETISTLKLINEIDGFLLGRASLDFQEFENIVLYSQQC